MDYYEKLERNRNVYDKCPEELKEEVGRNINWAINVISRLDSLDYDVREKAIETLHQVLDDDYQKMGFSIEAQKK